VDVPSQYLDQVLKRMDGTTIRSKDARIRVASPKEKSEAPPKDRFRPKGKKVFRKPTAHKRKR
jgi:hypothetical protein